MSFNHIQIGDLVEIYDADIIRQKLSSIGYIIEVKGTKNNKYYMVKIFDTTHPVPLFPKRVKLVSKA